MGSVGTRHGTEQDEILDKSQTCFSAPHYIPKAICLLQSGVRHDARLTIMRQSKHHHSSNSPKYVVGYLHWDTTDDNERY